MTRLQRLFSEQGQSPWLDNLKRGYITSGELSRFIAEGIRRGERGVLAIFEEHPEDYLLRAKDLGLDLAEMVRQGDLRLIYLRPLDLSADEILREVQQAVNELGAQRLVLDSLNGLELSLAPNFREEFQESFYRLIGSLTAKRVTVLMTVEVTEAFDQLTFSPHSISFLSQNIIFLRYVEIDGRLQRVLAVVKMRGSEHSADLRRYVITSQGMAVFERLAGYQGILTGVPVRRDRPEPHRLTRDEHLVLEKLREHEESTELALAEATGLPISELAWVLRRLLDLGEVVTLSREGTAVFRPVAPTLGYQEWNDR